MGGQIILLCGRSFSGKSTVAHGLREALGGVVVSLDAINEERDLRGGQGIAVKEWARTNDVAHQRVAAELVRDATVIIDDTSSPRFLRDAWRELSTRSEAAFVLVFIDAARETIVQRQAANRADGARRDVIDRVMTEHLGTFEPPAATENALRFKAEGLCLAAVVEAVTTTLTERSLKDRLTARRSGGRLSNRDGKAAGRPALLSMQADRRAPRVTRCSRIGTVEAYPVLMHTALDSTDCRALAEFYRVLLGLRYRAGDEAPDADDDWLVLVDPDGRRVLAVNRVRQLARPTWPSDDVPKQMHQDFRVPDVAELERQRRRAEDLGATLLHDRSGDADEPLYVLADPAGHPFCLLVG